MAAFSRAPSSLFRPLADILGQVSAGTRAPIPVTPEGLTLTALSPTYYENPATRLLYTIPTTTFTKPTIIGGLANLFSIAGGLLTGNYVGTASNVGRLALQDSLTPKGSNFMAYYDPTTGGWTETPTAPASTGSGAFGLSDIFGGSSASDWLGLLSKGLDVYSTYQTNASPAVRAVTTAGGVAVGGMMVGGVRAVGSALFRRFPNLAAGLNALKMAGKNYATRSRLYSLLKRFGPDVLITGGILSAAAVSELMIAGPGRRRMNSANVKALRRAHRRMASFHHICRKNDALMHRGGRRKPAGRFAGTSITQVK